jgi:hypothetical protein
MLGDDIATGFSNTKCLNLRPFFTQWSTNRRQLFLPSKLGKFSHFYNGVIFWPDFVQWRNAKTGRPNFNETVFRSQECHATKPPMIFTGRAAQLLAECG